MITEKDENVRLYPKWHLSVEDPLLAIYKKGLHEIIGFESLRNKSIIWMRGYDFDKLFLKGIPHKKHELNSPEKGLSLIIHNRYDVFLDYSYTVENASKNANMDISSLETVIIKPGNKLYLNFSNSKKSRELILLYDKRIPELLRSGKLKQIFDRYNRKLDKFSPDRYNNSKE